VATSSLEKFKALRDLVERRIDAGASAPSELSITLARLGQTNVQLTALKTSEAMAKARLFQLSGLEPLPGKLPTDAFSKVQPPILDDVLAFSPALKKAQLQVALAEVEAKLKRAQSFPEIYARAEHQRYPAGQNASRVFAGLQSNFGAGLSQMDEVAALLRRVETLREEFKSKQMEVTQQYDAMFLSLQQASQGLLDIESNVDASAQSLASMERQFLTGRRTWIDVLNAVRESMQAEMELIDAKTAILRAQWRLNLMAKPVEEVTSHFEKLGL
jgi:adhesin transport system outer membrane protein